MPNAALRIPREYRMCRSSYRHRWDDYIPAPGEVRKPEWGKRFSMRCERCGMVKHQIIDSLGEVSSTYYKPPKGYALAAEDVPTFQQLRLSLVSEYQSELREALTDRAFAQREKKAKAAAKKTTARKPAVKTPNRARTATKAKATTPASRGHLRAVG